MTHQPDTHRAIAELLRNRTAAVVLRLLKMADLSVPELAAVAKRNEGAIRTACRSLRLTGLVVRLDGTIRLRGRGIAHLWRYAGKVNREIP